MEWFLFPLTFVIGAMFGAVLTLQTKRDHIIGTAPEDDLLRELKRRRFEREVKAKIEADLTRELQGVRPPPPMTGSSAKLPAPRKE